VKVAQTVKKFCAMAGNLSIILATVLVLLACLAFGRLFYGPVNLDFARDTVLERAAIFLPSWDISYETAIIGWDWRSVRPWLSIKDVSLIDRRQRLAATIPETRVGVSFAGLMTGAGVSLIEINNASVQVIDLAGFSDDTNESMFGDLFAFDGGPNPAIFKPIAEAFSRFSARLLDNAPRLETIAFVNTNVAISRDDGFPDIELAMPSFRLSQDNQELTLAAQVDAQIVDQQTRVRLTGSAEPAIGGLVLNLSFADVDFASIATATELPELFSYMHFPIGLNFGLDITSAAGLKSASFNLNLGEGYLSHPVSYPEPAVLKYGVISGAFDVAEEVISIERIELAPGGRTVQGTGLIFWDEAYRNPGIQLDIAVDEVTIDEVLAYWPIKTHPDGRRRGARVWVDDNMKSGFARDVKFSVQLNPDGTSPFLNNSPHQILFKLDDVETTYLKEMSPLVGVNGNASLTETTFEVEITNGTVEGLPLAGSNVSMTDIHVPYKGLGVFDVALAGPVQDILTVITPPPVRVAERLNIDMNRLGGDAVVAARITMPLLKNLPKEDVLYEIEATLEQAYVKDLLDGEGLTEASLKFALDKDLLAAEGTGKINGVPMDLYWREDFSVGRSDSTADTSFLVMTGKVDESGLAALGVNVQEYMNGEAIAEASFLGRDLKFRVGYFSADVSEAQLQVPQLSWQKKPSSPANITGTLSLEDGGAKLNPIVIKGEDVDIAATMTFGAKDTGIFSLHADVAKLGNNIMTVDVDSQGNMPIKAIIDASVFDLAPMLLSQRAGDEITESTDNENFGGISSTKAQESSGFHLSLKAEKLLLLNGEELEDTEANLEFADNEPKNLYLSGQDGIGTMRVLIVQGPDKPQVITAETQDAGKLLRGLGIFSHLQGGSLFMAGNTEGWGDTLALSGEIEVKDTVVVSQKSLGEQVNEGVIGGVDEYLKGDEVELAVAEMPFSFNQGLLDINNLKANGPSLGMTMKGQIQTDEGKVNVNGVIVPAYGLNSILGKIPLIGGLFSGGEGKGLIGITYRIKGLTDNIQVTINPLTGLIPGFLRVLFEGSKGKVSSVEDAKPAEQPENNNIISSEKPSEPLESDAPALVPQN